MSTRWEKYRTRAGLRTEWGLVGSASKNWPEDKTAVKGRIPPDPWQVISAKTEGLTPGFVIRDARGDVYFIKTDPPQYPQLTTSTEVIVSKFFHAFGYNVAENYLIRIEREKLQLDEEAEQEKKISQETLEAVTEKMAWRPDGTAQVVASLKIPGEVLGPFKYYDTRPDDPNDVIPHQNRRELRGLRVLAAWLNHTDIKSLNSLDTFVAEEGERGFVRHYLMDFGSCLGAGAVAPKREHSGYQYALEWVPLLKSAFSLGLWEPSWRKTKLTEHVISGHLEADVFDPAAWKPEYPNAAFERMSVQDAFWAARIILAFDEPGIRAIVETGQIEDAEDEERLVKTLMRRREKILHHYLEQLNPLDRFQVDSDRRLSFENLGEQIRLGAVRDYQHQWFEFDNQSDRLTAITGIQSSKEPSLVVPSHASSYLMVRIRSLSPRQPHWAQSVDVYLRTGPSLTVVGIERPADFSERN